MGVLAGHEWRSCSCVGKLSLVGCPGRWSWRDHVEHDARSGSNPPGTAGVVVDAQGVLHKQEVPDPGGRLTRERIAAARAAGRSDGPPRQQAPQGLAQPAGEAMLRANQGVPTDEMQYLAGLQRVQYVFYYPETKDIVIAGPAEGWVTDLSGPRRGHHQRPARAAVAGSGRGAAGLSARRRGDTR